MRSWKLEGRTWKFMLCAGIAAAALSICAHAQSTATATTPPAPAATTPAATTPATTPAATTPTATAVPTDGVTKTSQFLGDLTKIGTDLWSALKDANFQNGVVTEPFGIIHDSDIGGGLAIETANTNGLNLGFAMAGMTDHQKITLNGKTKTKTGWDFYDAALSIQMGKQLTVPGINLPIYLYTEVGPAANLAHATTVLEQSVSGVKVILANGRLDIGAGIVQNSEWSTPGGIFHVGFNW